MAQPGTRATKMVGREIGDAGSPGKLLPAAELSGRARPCPPNRRWPSVLRAAGGGRRSKRPLHASSTRMRAGGREEPGVAAGLLQQSGQGALFCEEGHAAGVGADGGVAGVRTGHQHAAEGGAHGAAGVGVGETGAFERQLVDAWAGLARRGSVRTLSRRAGAPAPGRRFSKPVSSRAGYAADSHARR
jgi:hypothetical protein